MDVTGVAFWGVLGENQCMNRERYCAFLEKYVSDWASAKGVNVPV
jgi:hypothetical protein